MSLSLTEKYTLGNDTIFVNQVKVQAVLTAIALSATSTDETVKGYCQLILKDPENVTRSLQLARGVASQIDVPDLNSIADSIIQLNVQSIFSAYAYAEFNKIQGAV